MIQCWWKNQTKTSGVSKHWTWKSSTVSRLWTLLTQVNFRTQASTTKWVRKGKKSRKIRQLSWVWLSRELELSALTAQETLSGQLCEAYNWHFCSLCLHKPKGVSEDYLMHILIFFYYNLAYLKKLSHKICVTNFAYIKTSVKRFKTLCAFPHNCDINQELKWWKKDPNS